MIRYELLKQNEEIIYQFIKNGIMSYQILRDLEIYQRFLELNEETNELKFWLIADEFELSKSRIEQIIMNMRKEIV